MFEDYDCVLQDYSVAEILTFYHCILYKGIFHDAYFVVQGLQMTNPYKNAFLYGLKNA